MRRHRPGRRLQLLSRASSTGYDPVNALAPYSERARARRGRPRLLIDRPLPVGGSACCAEACLVSCHPRGSAMCLSFMLSRYGADGGLLLCGCARPHAGTSSRARAPAPPEQEPVADSGRCGRSVHGRRRVGSPLWWSAPSARAGCIPPARHAASSAPAASVPPRISKSIALLELGCCNDH